jgi:hypothetical protein
LFQTKITSDEQFARCFYAGPHKKGDSGLTVTVETAQKIIKYYPDCNLVGIGRTPAWLIKIAELIDKNPQPYQYQTVAFSGRWYQLQPHLLKPTAVSAPDEKQILAYRHYLKNLNFTPETIIQHERLYQRKTVLIDYLRTGLSLYSFVSFILNWAEELKLKDQLVRALIIHDLSKSDRDQKDSLFSNLSMQVNQFHSDLLKNQFEEILWEYLSQSTEKISGVFPVTEFRKDQWLNAPVESEENLQIQRSIGIKIFYYLKENGLLP